MNSPIHRIRQPVPVVPEMICEIKILVGKDHEPVVAVKGITDKTFLTGVIERAKLKVMMHQEAAPQPAIEVPSPEAQKTLLSD